MRLCWWKLMLLLQMQERDGVSLVGHNVVNMNQGSSCP